MLVLTRREGETVVIRDDVIVTVVEVRGDKVRLGIAAPADVSVHRGEVYAAIRGQNGGGPVAPGGRPRGV